MKILKFMFRAVGYTASFSLFILGLAVTVYALIDGVSVIMQILDFAKEESVIYKTMGVIDLILLGFSIFIASIGIYELFVIPIKNLPNWIQVKDLDALKSMLIKVTIVVMGISFMGRVVTWDGQSNLLNYGLAVAAVILALSYFLTVKVQEKKSEKK